MLHKKMPKWLLIIITILLLIGGLLLYIDNQRQFKEIDNLSFYSNGE